MPRSPGPWSQVTRSWGVTVKHWFPPGKFLPRQIQYNPQWQRYPESHRAVLRDLCWHSYLVRRSPTRRYCTWTYGQIAERVGLSRIQVLRIMHRLMADGLIYRWYAGDSGSNTPDGRPRAPRYELPASNGMLNWWKRVRKRVRVKVKKRIRRLRKRRGGPGRRGDPRGSCRQVTRGDPRSPPGPYPEI